MSNSKAVTYFHCLQTVKRRLQNPPAPSKPQSALEKELSSCSGLGKGPVIMECQRQAPKRVEARRKAAEKPRSSPLERQLQSCQSLGKGPAIMQCQREAKKNLR